MKVSPTILFICLTFFLWCGGCTQEESPPSPAKKQKIVVPIKKSVLEKAETPLQSTGEKIKEETKEATHAKTATVEEKAIQPSATKAKEKEAVTEEVSGYYIVKKGDTLSTIAGRGDVYGNPLKWPILYRLNMNKLDTLQVGEGFLEREIPEGVRLKIITPDEARENFKRNAHNIWSVNVLSATTIKEIFSSTIRLIRSGYPAYITSATVKGKDWMRLRVGFFKNKTEANLERKKINALLNLDNSWIVKTGKELEEFGGY